MDFSGGSPVTNNGVSGTTFNESVTVVSDGSGNVLFYSDGTKVWDASYTLMPSGTFTGAGGTSSAQGALAISKPGSNDVYYIFTSDDIDNATDHGIRYHEVDMTAAGNGTVGSPLGDVISSDNVQEATSSEMLAATGCGDTTWVVGYSKTGTTFYAIPVTSAGPQATIKSSLGVNFTTDAMRRGTMDFSSDGTKLVMTHANGAKLYDFNLSTGAVSNEVAIGGLGLGAYGSEFSPNDAIIYFTAVAGFQGLYHYNVSSTVTTQVGNSEYYGEIVTGDDGVLYAGKWVGAGETTLTTISNPNSTTATAVGIGLSNNGFATGGTVALGLPQNYACASVSCPDTSISQPSNVCVGQTEDLSLHELGDAGSWSITSTPAGGNPAIMTGDIFDASASNTDPGSYTVTFTFDAPVGGCSSTSSRTITVDSLPVVDLGNDTAICADANIIFDAGTGYTYAWTPGLEITQTINVNSANTYGVTITDGNGCTGSDNITLTIDTLPVVDLGNDTAICADAKITFDAGAGYTYAWTPGLEITQTINKNTASTYGVTITDGNG